MVWELLTYAGGNKIIPSFIPTYDETIRVYADSNGECVLFQTKASEDQNRAACGARHGCFCCTAISADKSMDNLLSKDEYSYLRPLNRIREYIFRTHWDWNDRVITQRGIDPWGFSRLQPVQYSFEKCKRILHAMISCDAIEENRAENYRLKLENGEISDTPTNRRLSNPQFKLVSQEDLLRIDFLWSLHSFCDEPWAALKIWKKVYVEDEYELLEEIYNIPAVPRSPQPAPYYLYVGKNWSKNGYFQGLRDVSLETVAWETGEVIQKKNRKINSNISDETEWVSLMYMDVADSLSVNDEWLYWVFNDDHFERNSNGNSVSSAALQMLRNGVISIAKGKETSYHYMAERIQFYEDLNLNGAIKMSDLESRCDLKLLTHVEYQRFKSIIPSKAKAYEFCAEDDVDLDELDVDYKEEQLDLLSSFIEDFKIQERNNLQKVCKGEIIHLQNENVSPEPDIQMKIFEQNFLF